MKTSAQELFLQANQCYSKKEYTDAEHLYKKIPTQSAAVWYNRGNCAYKNGKDLEALLYWKRAKKLGINSIAHDSDYNSTVVSQKLNILSHSPHRMPHIPALPLQILFFCTFSVFLVINRKLWRAKRFALLLIMSALVMGTGLMAYATYRNTTKTTALIMQEQSTMFAGPDSGYHEIAQPSQGTEVIVLNKKTGWTKINWSGHVGWIQNEKIEII